MKPRFSIGDRVTLDAYPRSAGAVTRTTGGGVGRVYVQWDGPAARPGHGWYYMARLERIKT